MKTRRQMFEESNPMKVHYVGMGGITFINFPAAMSSDGELGYDGGMVDVAKQIASQIPESLRPAVTVDFEKVPAWEMREKILEQAYGGPLPEQHEIGEAATELLRLMTVEADE
ncbi:MAG: hypothetical protein K6T83_16835 [Alicyclobacillus sp.]|nr:hypothetical protein [Alicyclobacillus sp.]